ncbi:hypothetical protein KUTeg_008218 [Tegillarca granosa]|uniref:DDE-1 domain-containing protein n=1 Tax=Tegillarca granosa TaxID=220873 RepID=A0ABQ9F8H7_TEGGR|nr:hypothetical protein KUTeg_008218 [Tegillarca granosa]
MKIQGSHVLMFLDNASCHVHTKLTNVTLEFLPPNTKVTSNGPENYPSSKISVYIGWLFLETIRSIRLTIQKCFVISGFILDTNEEDNCDSEYDDILLAVFQMARDIFGMEFHDLVCIDEELSSSASSVVDWDKNAKELLLL